MTEPFDVAWFDQGYAEARDAVAYLAQQFGELEQAYGRDAAIVELATELYAGVPALHLASWLAAAIAKEAK
jgi:hypothetical protein